MKPSPQTLSKTYASRGIALVIVLSAVVLLAALVIGFMSSVMTERNSVNVASGGIHARQIAENTVSLVMGQIREATTSAASGTSTWASQPGAIRVFSGTISAAPNATNKAMYTYTGTNDFVYKLYSAESLKVRGLRYRGTSGDELALEAAVITNWDRTNPLPDYVDLNEPIILPVDDPSSTVLVEPRYPIIDPRAKADLNGAPKSGPEMGLVDGFDIKTIADPTLKMKVKNPVNGTVSEQSVPYLPMPVKWLYVLKDGKMVAPNAAGIIQDASEENPIVGRTAFWTDDESCKLNLNTATEGVFWDTPSISSKYETGLVAADSLALYLDNGVPANTYTGYGAYDMRGAMSLGASQPVKGEFQRYPGHPATTSLSPVFGWMWMNDGTNADHRYRWNQDTSYTAFREAIYAMSPFSPIFDQTSSATVSKQTTKGATHNAGKLDAYFPNVNQPKPDLNTPTFHLYASVDEYMFQPKRFSGGTTLLNPPPVNVSNSTVMNTSVLEQSRFFLTTSSRAPEVNLFGKPRVSIWPVHPTSTSRTNLDNLTAFSSSLKSGSTTSLPFYFVRQFNKSSTKDYTNFQGNRDIFGYLMKLTRSNIPGFGGNFDTKYPSDRGQILTCIFDYIRCVNLVDTSSPAPPSPYNKPFYTSKYYTNPPPDLYANDLPKSNEWAAQVIPISISDKGVTAKGMGRFPTLSEAAIIFYRYADPLAPADPRRQKIRAVIALEMTTTMSGYPALRETYYTTMREVVATKINVINDSASAGVNRANTANFVDMGFPKTAIANFCDIGSQDVGFGRSFMPGLGWATSMYYYSGETTPKGYSKIKAKIFRPTVGADSYPYVSNEFTLPDFPFPAPPPPAGNPNAYAQWATQKEFAFTGGEFELKIYPYKSDEDSVPVQTLSLKFPPTPLKFRFPQVDAPGGGGALQPPLDRRLALNADSAGLINKEGAYFLKKTDVVRGLEYTGKPVSDIQADVDQMGDVRLGNLLKTVPAEYYQPREGNPANLAANKGYFQDYQSSLANQRFQTHGLTYGHGEHEIWAYPSPTDSTVLAQEPTIVAMIAAGAYGDRARLGYFGLGGTTNVKRNPILPYRVTGVKNSDGGAGDYDRGLSKNVDLAGFNKVDEGTISFDSKPGTPGRGQDVFSPGYRTPYYRGLSVEETGESYFSPNRQLSSAVMFGSIPTGASLRKPWQTLMFRPNRGTVTHPGAKTPPDHLLLDLFYMPVVEPYAISEPFSTAGKINLNSVLAPFGYADGNGGNNTDTTTKRSYIRRDTALRGLMKSTKIMAVNGGTTGPAVESGHSDNALLDYKYRWSIDLNRTLDVMETRIKDPFRGLFRSASEICEVDLYPLPDHETTTKDGNTNAGKNPITTPTNWDSFWDVNYSQTGDNARERPYAHLYPRVTTKSNVFTVHMRCQAIKKGKNSDDPDHARKFNPGKDVVVGEYRGATTIERFIDPNDPKLRDYTFSNDDVPILDDYYRFRVVSTKQFSPR